MAAFVWVQDTDILIQTKHFTRQSIKFREICEIRANPAIQTTHMPKTLHTRSK